MPLDTETFKTRTATAIIFAVVMLAGLLWNEWSFIILFTLIHFGCWIELINLLKKISPSDYLAKALVGLLYITLPMILMFFMRTDHAFSINETELKIIPCAIVFSIWINDTMAYIVGSFIGKHPLSSISPKKTWEGTVGGIILSVIVIALLGNLTGYFSLATWIMIPLISAVTGTFGDLLESKLKRMAGVKDSGNLMPGHGGFLDRFDSLLIAIPFVFFFYLAFIR